MEKLFRSERAIPQDVRTIHQIWLRSRTRELAHGFAAERLERDAECSHKLEMFLNILGLALLVFGLSIGDEALKAPLSEELAGYFKISPQLASTHIEVAKQAFLILSAIVSVLALLFAVTNNRRNNIIMHGRHKLVARMFMSISQKVRRLDTKILGKDYIESLIYSLNDQFETILTSGENPADEDYNKAHKRMRSIIRGEGRGIITIFVPNVNDQELDEFIDGLFAKEDRVEIVAFTLRQKLEADFVSMFESLARTGNRDETKISIVSYTYVKDGFFKFFIFPLFAIRVLGHLILAITDTFIGLAKFTITAPRKICRGETLLGED